MNTAKIGAKSNSDKSGKVKNRLACIRLGLSEDVNIAALELLGVKGKKYCQGLLDTLGQVIQAADSQEVDSDE